MGESEKPASYQASSFASKQIFNSKPSRKGSRSNVPSHVASHSYVPSGKENHSNDPSRINLVKNIKSKPPSISNFNKNHEDDPSGSLPLGMVQLASMDRIRVKQKVHLHEVLCGCCESGEHYDLFAPKGNPLIPMFVADEDSGCCGRNLCKNLRGLKMNVTDRDGNLMFTSKRNFKCGLCICMSLGQCYCCKSDCCPCFLDEICIFGPDGEEYGRIIESWSLCRSFYKVYDGHGHLAYYLQGPCFPCTFFFCCKTANFKLKNARTGKNDGKIYKEHSGIVKEIFSEADNFGVVFPADIDVKMKAVLISGVFLIDMIHFEQMNETVNDNN